MFDVRATSVALIFDIGVTMSLYFARQTIKRLLRDYGTREPITLTRYIKGDVDYANPIPANKTETLIVQGIAMPKNTNTVWFQRSTFTWDKNIRLFVILVTRTLTPDWLVEGANLTYQGQTFNIKSADLLEGVYYHVTATADGNESENRSFDDAHNS
jgi:hypothetical protein